MPCLLFFWEASNGWTTGRCQLYSSCSGPLFAKPMLICSLFLLCIAHEIPLSACLSRTVEWPPQGTRRISFSFYTLTMQRQDHKCVTSAYSASLNINISHNIAIHVACSVFSSIALNLTSSVFHGFICLFSFTHKEVPENLPRSCRQACC